ncbi:hypothetical protein [Streptomyces swartbergensis]|uniref:Uncharacterized protein n=1 Tax=Streptomyces swartbergensis TaxID=487165 RepID=A0A243RYQ2_9ACTN|nr:hypothetical protein [Streptomyces swartbergensis]OUD00336.1 hypothetical protein CA983_26145 [Streptomyces swartbergensis]
MNATFDVEYVLNVETDQSGQQFRRYTQQVVRRLADAPAPDVTFLDSAGQDLSPEEQKLVADRTASTINHTLAMLFLRLGPPPEATNGDFSPVTSGGGGVRQ